MLVESESSRQAEVQRELSGQGSHGKWGELGLEPRPPSQHSSVFFSTHKVICLPQRAGLWPQASWQCPTCGEWPHTTLGAKPEPRAWLDGETGSLPWGSHTRPKSQACPQEVAPRSEAGTRGDSTALRPELAHPPLMAHHSL